MVFFTIVFLIFYITLLAKGNIFLKLHSIFAEEEVRKQKEGSDNYKPSEDMIGATIIMLIVGLPLILGQFIYLCNAIKYDTYTYPTLILLTYTVVNFIVTSIKNKKKVDLSTEDKVEKYRAKYNKKRTVKGTLFQITYTVYFLYMLIQLIFN